MKTLKLLLPTLLCFILIPSFLNSQVPQLQWQKTLGGTQSEEYNGLPWWPGVNRALLEVSDGFVVAVHTFSNDGDISGNHGDRDIWVSKLDKNRNIIWSRCVGGSYFDELGSISQDIDGGYILIGSTQSIDGDVTGYRYSMDV